MAIIMKLCGAIGPFGDIYATPGDGQFLKEFDFEAHDGLGEIVMTPDPEEAMQFPDMIDAMAFRNRSPVCKPTRYDGRPNRPLTATNWEFGTLEEADDAGVA